GVAPNKAKLTALNGMGANLQSQVSLCLGSPGQDHQAAGFLVEAMYGADPSRPGWPPTFFCPGSDERRQHIDERRRQKPPRAGAELRRLMRVTHRCQSCRLIHDNNVLIQIDDSYLLLHGLFLPLAASRTLSRKRRSGFSE